MPNAKGAQGADQNVGHLPFEEAMSKLEAIVEAMESQDLPLAELLAKYEEGSRLVQLCQNRLNEAELKIQQLERTARGELSVKPAAIENNLREEPRK